MFEINKTEYIDNYKIKLYELIKKEKLFQENRIEANVLSTVIFCSNKSNNNF